MNTVTVLLAFSLLLFIKSSEQNALKNPDNTRIAGGSEVDIKDFPYQLYIKIKKSPTSSSICGGSIISKDWALTAAHCILDFPAENITVYAGSANRYVKVDVHEVAKAVRHPIFSTAHGDCDIAVLKVKNPFNFNNVNIRPITLIGENQMVPDGTKVTVSGWGHTNSTDEKPGNLRATEVEIKSRKVCEELYGSGFTRNMICVDSDDGLKNSCSGDSGGPLVTKDKIQVGIVSFGFGCVLPLKPKVYANITALRSWVREQTNV